MAKPSPQTSDEPAGKFWSGQRPGIQRLDVDDAVTWMREACNVVAQARDVAQIHNDLKPANLFLSANNNCLVGDFGMAALVPATGFVMPAGATAETAAPEVAAGWGSIDSLGDV